MGQKKSKLSKEILHQIAEHTQRSPAEIKHMHQVFQQHFPRGRIESPEDLYRCLKKFSATPFNENDTSAQRRLFRIFQQNNEHEPIDFFQFMIISNILERGSSNQRISLYFRSFDIDRDDLISKKDLEACLPRTQNSAAIIDQLLIEWDYNGDGVVEYQDFYDYIMNHPQLSVTFGIEKETARSRVRMDSVSSEDGTSDSPNVYKVNPNRSQFANRQD